MGTLGLLFSWGCLYLWGMHDFQNDQLLNYMFHNLVVAFLMLYAYLFIYCSFIILWLFLVKDIQTFLVSSSIFPFFYSSSSASCLEFVLV